MFVHSINFLGFIIMPRTTVFSETLYSCTHRHNFFKHYFLKRFYLFISREWEGREKEREVASHMSPVWDLAYNPGMCPDCELNQWPFGSQVGAQLSEPHQPGLDTFLSTKIHCYQFSANGSSQPGVWWMENLGVKWLHWNSSSEEAQAK